MFYVFRVRAEKRLSRHIGASSFVWTLTNQIARLVAIVVKNKN